MSNRLIHVLLVVQPQLEFHVIFGLYANAIEEKLYLLDTVPLLTSRIDVESPAAVAAHAVNINLTIAKGGNETFTTNIHTTQMLVTSQPSPHSSQQRTTTWHL